MESAAGRCNFLDARAHLPRERSGWTLEPQGGSPPRRCPREIRRFSSPVPPGPTNELADFQFALRAPEFAFLPSSELSNPVASSRERLRRIFGIPRKSLAFSRISWDIAVSARADAFRTEKESIRRATDGQEHRKGDSLHEFALSHSDPRELAYHKTGYIARSPGIKCATSVGRPSRYNPILRGGLSRCRKEKGRNRRDGGGRGGKMLSGGPACPGPGRYKLRRELVVSR